MVDQEHRRFSESILLETIEEQQDDENILSVSSNSTLDQHSIDRKQQENQEEIQQFEALENEISSNRHGFRVQFASSSDKIDRQENDWIFPDGEKTFVRTLPLFRVQSNEDQVTKHFYENQFQFNVHSNHRNELTTPSEVDSLEDYSNNQQTIKQEQMKSIDDQIDVNRSATTPNKSILKKSIQSDENKTKSRSPSPNSSKKKVHLINNDQTNEFPYIAELTAKQQISSNKLSIRSLFEPTINIFDCSTSNGFSPIRRRPSRLRYYIKPYRGEANTVVEPISKQRSRSLSEQRNEQQTGTKRWFTFSNQYQKPTNERLNRKQHVSWSPVRQYIHQGRNQHPQSSTNKEGRDPSNKDPNLFNKQTSLSSSSPCIPSSSSLIPIPIRYRSSRFSQTPKHFDQSFSRTNDFYETSSVPDRTNLTPITPSSISDQEQDKQQKLIRSSSSSENISENKFNHQQTLQRYDRLLEKMKMTDEQLQKLSTSWNNSINQPSTLLSQTKSNGTHSSDRHQFDSRLTTNHSETWSSTMILQLCLFILVIFNVCIVYFFKDIHLWWNKYFRGSIIVEQHDHAATSEF